MVTGKKMAEAKGKELILDDDPAKNFSCLSEILKERAKASPEHVLFSLHGNKVSCWNVNFEFYFSRNVFINGSGVRLFRWCGPHLHF